MENRLLSITQVCLLLNLTPQTIKRWYRWVKKTGRNLDMVDLPEYIQDNRGTWYFQENLIYKLTDFQNNLKRGQMADFHKRYYWSKKGETDGQQRNEKLTSRS